MAESFDRQFGLTSKRDSSTSGTSSTSASPPSAPSSPTAPNSSNKYGNAPVGSQEYNFERASDPNVILPANLLTQYNSLKAQSDAWYAAHPNYDNSRKDGTSGNKAEAEMAALLQPYLPKNYNDIINAIGDNQLGFDAKGNFVALNQDNSFLGKVIPILSELTAAFVLGGEIFGSAGGAAATTGEVASSTAAAGEAAAATTAGAETATAAGEAAAATTATAETATAAGIAAGGAATIPEVLVTGSAIPGGLTAAQIAAVGSVGIESGLGFNSIQNPTIAQGKPPTVNAGPSNKIGQYLYKNTGLNSWQSQIAGSSLQGSGINAAIAAITGGNVWKAAGLGAVGGAVGGGLGVLEQAGGPLSAIPETAGKIGTAAFNSAVSGGTIAAITGQNIGKSMLIGAGSGALGSIVGSYFGQDGESSQLGSTLGGIEGSFLMNKLVNGGGPQPFTPLPSTSNNRISTTPGNVPNFNIGSSSVGSPGLSSAPASRSFGSASSSYSPGFAGGGGGAGPSDDDYSYWEDQKKLKQLLAALQAQGGNYGVF
jgi:hypothetical protein